MTLCSGLSREQSNELYLEVLADRDTETMRRLVREDLFFLMTVACKRKDMDHDWIYDRCREVESSPDGHLDLWAREHYKSTIITFGKSIQDILVDPDHTLIGIFSHTRKIAKGFLTQIKRELETNSFLKSLFPEILFADPQNEAPTWSLDDGIIVKRSTNPKESTVEAWGLVDGQPTSKHFTLLIYDDVVTLESVTTTEQIAKVLAAWEMSLSLGARGGRKRYIGTRYHFNDTYKTMMERGSAKPRVKPATVDGKDDGAPVFLPVETLREKRRDMGLYTFGTQMLLNPVADKSMGFKKEWLRFYEKLGPTKDWNKFLLVDPASKKKSTNDYTVMWVIGLAPDQNYYVIDGLRDRLNLTKRADAVFAFHRKWRPKVGYEEYGLQADIEHIKYVQEEKNYRFPIKELGGSLAKEDRIKKLVPLFEQGRIWFPKTLTYIDSTGKPVDLVRSFIEDEYDAFPVCTHDDMLDDLARITDPDLEAKFPKAEDPPAEDEEHHSGGGSWMG